MNGEKSGTLDFCLHERQDEKYQRIRKQIDAFLRQMALCGAFAIRFSLTFWSPGVENIPGVRLGRFRIASVHRMSSWR